MLHSFWILIGAKVAYYYLCSMKFTPKAIFFDWDHTLWDHDLNAREVLNELFDVFKLPHVDSTYMWQSFQQINDALWEDYQLGRISQATLREIRFVKFFDALQITGPVEEFSEAYMYQTPRKTNLISDAYAVVDMLSQKYPLYILTNGFNDIQWVKIKGAGMAHFFQEIITSEISGHKKPAKGFFDYALQVANVAPEEALMVGDHPIIDIQGAAQAGIAGIHLNQRAAESTAKIQIKELRELVDWIA